MIERKKAQDAFKKYVAPYDVTNEKIALKISHTYRTAQVSEGIVKSLKMDDNNVDLAWLIGLLHDIGRFDQLRIYDTFDDRNSIDHADFGVKLLFEDGLIRKFISETKYDSIIYKAIKNHNKYEIESGLTEAELVHAKIIRDADKTDIFEVHVREIENNSDTLYDAETIKTQKVSQKVLEAFLNHQLINSKDKKNDIDQFVLLIAFIYDYNYQCGLDIIKQKRYIERMMKVVEGCEETKEQADLIKKTALEFLEK